MPTEPSSNGPGPRAEPRAAGGAVAACGVVALVAATVLAGALLPARDAGPHALPGRPVAEDPGCLEWGDGCRVCRRLAAGPACSLPGIACQPGEPRCLLRAGG